MFTKEEELECLLENLATDFSQKCKVFAPKAFANMVSILCPYLFLISCGILGLSMKMFWQKF